MVDTGTTYTYIIASEYKVLHSAFKASLEEMFQKHHFTLPTVSRLRVLLLSFSSSS